ncbi:MAG: YfiR family protein [Steroidobacteraceae bacterium]
MALLSIRCALLVMSAALSLAMPASAAAPTEYQVKAVFLFNFSQFVDWPPVAFAGPRSPIRICVLGHDPFGAALDDIVQGEIVNGRALEVQRSRRVEELGDCHILFIDRSEQSRLAEILAQLNGRSVLTVGDSDGFARRGGMIRFMTVGNKIRLRVNLDVAQAAGLTISSKLLRPAEIVKLDP